MYILISFDNINSLINLYLYYFVSSGAARVAYRFALISLPRALLVFFPPPPTRSLWYTSPSIYLRAHHRQSSSIRSKKPDFRIHFYYMWRRCVIRGYGTTATAAPPHLCWMMFMHCYIFSSRQVWDSTWVERVRMSACDIWTLSNCNY